MYKLGSIRLYAQANLTKIITYPLTLNLSGQPSKLTRGVQSNSLLNMGFGLKKGNGISAGP